MKTIFLYVATLFNLTCLSAQHKAIFLIQDAESGENLIGAAVLLAGTSAGTTTDEDGMATLENIPGGSHAFEVSYLGYEPATITLQFPADNGRTVRIPLHHEGEDLDEVIVTTSRGSRTIADTPTRIEAIGLEEIDEKSNMRPSNVSMILHESTGIQVQQTSATTANASIRIQGLDGRYTQLLKDGFANFGNFAGGLSILDLPPLDLQQVEVIKGPASTLYGGGAIAGVINFISKQPSDKRVISLQLNQSNVGASDLGLFLSGKSKKTGFTFLGTVNRHAAYDVDEDHFTEIPKTLSFSVTPRVWFYLNERSTLSISNMVVSQNRKGGDLDAIRDEDDPSHTYFEKNRSFRNLTTVEFKSRLSENRQLVARQSFSIFDRKIDLPDYSFAGIQYNAYTDISMAHGIGNHNLITGLNVVYDRFDEDRNLGNTPRDARLTTVGLYVQDTWDVNEKLAFENGVRLDHAGRYGLQLLPRISALYKLNPHWSGRISAGMGYSTPTIFTEETESLAYRGVLGTGDHLAPERSFGGTIDAGYKTSVGDLVITANQLFFYTRINRPMVLTPYSADLQYYVNAALPVNTSGFETNLKFLLEPFKFFAGYTFTRATAEYLTGNRNLPLVPESKLNLIALYEVHGDIKLGLEGYYTSPQQLSSGAISSDFWEFGFFIEKVFGKVALYFNAENFTDVRQSRFANVNEGTHTQPRFGEIWTHTEGRVISGGIKLKL